MAPAVVLVWAWLRRRGALSRAERVAAAIILVTYLIQAVALAAGLVAARRFADPFAHVADFAGLLGVILVAEYAGHAAAAALGVTSLRRSRTAPCR